MNPEGGRGVIPDVSGGRIGIQGVSDPVAVKE